jgi:hypothetical protein
MYLRTVKVPSSSGKINESVRIVEAYRQDGKVKQRVVADLGRKDVLTALLPQLQRLLQGENAIVDEDPASEVKVLEAATWGPMLLVQTLAQQLGLPAIFQELLKRGHVDDEDERREYEQAQRSKCMERTKEKLAALQKRVDMGTLTDAEQIGASAQRALSAHHGQRYYGWRLESGKFEFFEDAEKLDAEKRLEGKYVIGTSEKNFGMLEAVAAYKQLGEVERGFRSMQEVIGLRPIWHPKETRVKGHLFVAALALLLERLLEKRLKEAGVNNISARQAMLAVQTIRLVRFEVAGRERHGVTVGSAQARRVLAALGLSDLRPPTPPETEKTVV